jgi:hypothetical protein
MGINQQESAFGINDEPILKHFQRYPQLDFRYIMQSAPNKWFVPILILLLLTTPFPSSSTPDTCQECYNPQ